MDTMKAVRIHTYGGPEVLRYEDAPIPTPGEGQVLIRVHAAGVNPFDLAVRQGYMAGWLNFTLPLILGVDVSGQVVSVGPGVTSLKVGDEVFGRSNPAKDGTYAEYVAADVSAVVPKPRSLSHLEAAAAPNAGLTAWDSLMTTAELQPGQTLLIQGAAGGVGHLAVQLAKLHGAKVIGTTSVHKQEFLHQLGIDQAIDYTTTRFEDVVHDVDVVLDNVGGETQDRSWSVLKPGGILVSPAQMPSAESAAKHNVRSAFIASDTSGLPQLARLLEEGKLKPIVQTVLPLAKVVQAQEMIATRHTHGKIVLQVVA